MLMVRMSVLLSILCLVSASAFTQQTPSPGSQTANNPKAESLFQRAFSALTGGATVSDASLTGTVVRMAGSENETGTAVLEATSAGDSRIDLSLPSGEHVEIRNHAAPTVAGTLPPGVRPEDLPHGMSTTTSTALRPAGMWTEPDGSRHTLASHNALAEPTWFSPAVTISRLRADPNLSVSYVGEESHEGQSLLHLSVSGQSSLTTSPISTFLRHLAQIELFLDPTTYLPSAIVFNTHPETNAALDISNEVRFSDYRSVNGVQVPYHISRLINNSLVTDLRIESVTLNTGLTSTAFAIQ
jgi:hypothetical protein